MGNSMKTLPELEVGSQDFPAELSVLDRHALLRASFRLLGVRLNHHIPVRQSDIQRLLRYCDDSPEVAA